MSQNSKDQRNLENAGFIHSTCFLSTYNLKAQKQVVYSDMDMDLSYSDMNTVSNITIIQNPSMRTWQYMQLNIFHSYKICILFGTLMQRNLIVLTWPMTYLIRFIFCQKCNNISHMLLVGIIVNTFLNVGLAYKRVVSGCVEDC